MPQNHENNIAQINRIRVALGIDTNLLVNMNYKTCLTFSVVLLLTKITFQAAEPSTPTAPSEREEDQPKLLFVQDARGMSFTNGTLTLKDTNPLVLYFSDRPHRMAGHTTREETRDLVAESFTTTPPNAALVILDGDMPIDVVLTLNKGPTIDGDALLFEQVKIIEGEMPAIGGANTMYIDTIRRRRPHGPKGPGKPSPRGPGKSGPGGHHDPREPK